MRIFYILYYHSISYNLPAKWVYEIIHMFDFKHMYKTKHMYDFIHMFDFKQKQNRFP